MFTTSAVDDRDAPVHVPGADSLRSIGWTLGHLFPRRDAVRAERRENCLSTTAGRRSCRWGWSPIVTKMMATDPALRYQTAGEVRQAFDAGGGAQDVRAPRAVSPSPWDMLQACPSQRSLSCNCCSPKSTVRRGTCRRHDASWPPDAPVRVISPRGPQYSSAITKASVSDISGAIGHAPLDRPS